MGQDVVGLWIISTEDTLKAYFLENHQQLGQLLTSVASDCCQKAIIYSLREKTAGFMEKGDQ